MIKMAQNILLLDFSMSQYIPAKLKSTEEKTSVY